MKHVVIGTAGHVDHGKTMLVKALTGVDTDRLSEEKRRGMTIEPGFARLDFPDGSYAGIVDVPGHEKFIGNMLAGAGGVDLAMLVVAADEGFMPQTAEHLDILQLLGVQSGVIVLTKTDLADESWISMVKEDVERRVRGTFLEGKEILPVSAQTGQGLDALRSALYQLVLQAQEKNLRAPFRLPVDRAFSVDGFGTVVTGTVISGAVSTGDTVTILPQGRACRVRNLQVHGSDVASAYSGQRAAINLAGVRKEDAARGCTVAAPDSLRPTLMLDVRLQNLADSRRTIKSGSRLHFYHGSAVKLAKAVLLDRDSLAPGESCYAQLRLTEEVAARRGDRFVVRFYSPLETIGGGEILDEHPRRHKRGDASALAALAVRESGTEDERIVQAAAEYGAALAPLAALAAGLPAEEETLAAHVAELCARGMLLEPLPGYYLAAAQEDKIWMRCRTALESYHRAHPLHAGMPAAELRQKLFARMDRLHADAVLACLVREGRIKAEGEGYALADFSVHLTKRQSAIREEMLRVCRAAGLGGERTGALTARFDAKDRTECARVLEHLMSTGELVRLSPELCLERRAFEALGERLKAWFAAHDSLALAEFRDELGTSRDFALLVLEAYDRRGILRREGDVRRLGPRFSEL